MDQRNTGMSQKVTVWPDKIGQARSPIVRKQQRRLTGKKLTAEVTKKLAAKSQSETFLPKLKHDLLPYICWYLNRHSHTK